MSDIDYIETCEVTDLEKITTENIIAELVFRAGSRQKLRGILNETVGKAFEAALEPDETVDDLEPCELNTIGVRTARLLLKALGLPRFSTHKAKSVVEQRDLLLDTRIAGIDVDLKHSLGTTWMIPGNRVGSWCLVVKTDRYTREAKLGLLKTNVSRVGAGRNQDKKASVNVIGRAAIHWIV